MNTPDSDAYTFEEIIKDNSTDLYFCNMSIKQELLPILIVGCTGASVCAILCIIAILGMISFKLYKLLTHRLILYFLIAILVASTVDIIQLFGLWRNYWRGEHMEECIISGFLMQYTVWIMFLATLMMTLHLTSMVLFPILYVKVAKLEVFYLLFPWIFPLFIAWIPFLHSNYGVSGPWCWIKLYNDNCTPNTEGMIEMYALWYGELVIGLILNNIGLLVIATTLCKRACCASNEMLSDYRKALKQTLPLVAYPIVFQILTTFVIANRLYQIINKGHSIKWMFYAHAAASPAGSSAVAPAFTLVYLVTLHKVIRENIKKYKNCCLRKKKMKRNLRVSTGDHNSKEERVRLVDSHDCLTCYGQTDTCLTSAHIRRESEVDEEYMRRWHLYNSQQTV